MFLDWLLDVLYLAVLVFVLIVAAGLAILVIVGLFHLFGQLIGAT